ncbi:peptidoglycan-binding protein [Peterkaempfera sp. SMS 1(5)a]|uniref:peptidoglycan-binding domain-containing protein n=1 Tax=Peterkaempfera podocarpi TaxID=3232308 RepID=UPI00366A8AFB
MSLRNKTIRSIGILALVGACGLGLAGNASASGGAAYIGSGHSTDAHAVWCVQHDFDYAVTHWGFRYPAPATIAEDGLWGQRTESAVEWLQYAMGDQQDGIVGPQTGADLLTMGDPYYNGTPGAPGYCYQYIPGDFLPTS